MSQATALIRNTFPVITIRGCIGPIKYCTFNQFILKNINRNNNLRIFEKKGNSLEFMLNLGK